MDYKNYILVITLLSDLFRLVLIRSVPKHIPAAVHEEGCTCCKACLVARHIHYHVYYFLRLSGTPHHCFHLYHIRTGQNGARCNTKAADIDCAAAVAAGNAYAESIGFEIWSGCRSYFPPVFLERDCPESCWNQEWVESAIKQNVDYVKETAIRLGRWSPVDEVPEGCASAVNCVVRWNASAGYHEIYVYYAA